MIASKREKALKLFEQQVDKNNIEPLRNRHNYSLLSHNTEQNYNINIDYENFEKV